jgi:hypothetical protein
MYRTFIKPFDAKIIKANMSRGTRSLPQLRLHAAFVEDLIDIGADILHPFQGGINDQKTVQERYGDELFLPDAWIILYRKRKFLKKS